MKTRLSDQTGFVAVTRRVSMFADVAKIMIRSGRGGDGAVSFRREKYVSHGGPDGGDGGKGGDVVFVVDEGQNTLAEYRHRHHFFAENGEPGGKRRCHGKNGADVVLKVPPGTIVKDAASGKVIADMSGDRKKQVILTGGRGGNGNQHYATSTMQVPKYAQPGKPGMELEVLLELKVIADVGLVGFPNVGKSTLLSHVSNASPKIANYHFTTLNPNLGVVDLGDGEGFVLADIPGLIEGASEGVGLGFEFLRHIERTRVIVHVVDAAGVEGRDPIADIRAINHEMESFHPDLMKKPQLIAANKMDVLPAEERETVLTLLREEFVKDGIEVYPISAVTGEGLNELTYAIAHLLSTVEEEPLVYEQEFFPEMHIFDEEPYTVVYDDETGEYVVEGPRIEKMLGYTNIDSEKGFLFFQNFLKEQGILEELEKAGITDGDTVRMYGLTFDYYK